MSEDEPPRVMVAPTFEDTKSPDYRYVYATGVFGGIDPNGTTMIFYLDRLELETVSTPQPGAEKLKKILRELQVEIYMSPTTFKSVAEWMNHHIQQYEKIFGEIPMAPKKEEKRFPPGGLIT